MPSTRRYSLAEKVEEKAKDTKLGKDHLEKVLDERRIPVEKMARS